MSQHDPYVIELGARLRAARRHHSLSLHGVEVKSGGRFKAVVVGSYERGDRAVTVQRLAELADFYGCPIAALLPDLGAADGDTEAAAYAALTTATRALQAVRPDLATVLGRILDRLAPRRPTPAVTS